MKQIHSLTYAANLYISQSKHEFDIKIQSTLIHNFLPYLTSLLQSENAPYGDILKVFTAYKVTHSCSVPYIKYFVQSDERDEI